MVRMGQVLGIACAMLVGCGVSPSTPVNDLDADDWAKLCADATAGSTERTQDCGQYEASEPAYTAEDCEADASFYDQPCDAVVGDWQTCVQGLLTIDLCNPQAPSACDLIAECSAI